ncbi:hypothetical protein OG2516_15874 [Oceanicola granulosus HTCC2516]|uniref:Uncharacterized protein n=1 Tax=Oceanicola granulosus (strain ATCC BAA-861 / DSM 15982 / KCTC 12143 / HTCC2516) TaxID=314256 RepID=Q2C9N3_OCEGH|nr:hypothetical protein OG2516_15874 [Oceanicola granulosus HTCC2516]
MSGGRSDSRGMTVKVKKKRGLKLSSRRWLERQLNDPYVRAPRPTATARARPTS